MYFEKYIILSTDNVYHTTFHILSRKKFQAPSYSKNVDIENLLLLYFQSRSSSSATSSASKPDPEDEEESDGEEPSPRRSNRSK